VIDPSTHTLLLRYELPNGAGTLRAGMLATLAVETRRALEAVAIPVEAVIHDQGVPTVYVMLEGELFQTREVVLGVRDGGFVEVASGVAAGERVATRGAYFVKLAALSPASFGAGHAH
jgi:membrane fusion protein, heavy metal efflux system